MSIASELIDRGRLEIKLGDYSVGTAAVLSDPGILAMTQDYRRQSGSRMIPLGKSDISVKIPPADYHVSRKIDGEFAVLVMRDGEVLSINPGGTVRVGLPWQAEGTAALKKAKINDAMIAGEFYVHSTERRPRVHDVVKVARHPKSHEDLERLRFAAFDIISIDGQPAGEYYADTWQTIESLFAGGKLVHPVETRVLSDPAGVTQLFGKWVESEAAEGVVVRSDSAGTFKVKPRHTVDAVVIGFTESADDRAGLLHDLLLALMRDDGTLHVLCRVGGGFDEEQRRSLLSDLKDMVVASEYAEVNSDYVAYQMVRPDWVVEISCLDLISQTTRGGNINRMVLEFDAKEGFRVVRRLPLVTVISPQFVRMREDKSAHKQDVRMAQITDRVEVAQSETDAKDFKLPKTEILRREVFTKEAKGNTMVRKFVILQTNKAQEAEEYPAYVMHYTDFSPNRKEPLVRDVSVSSSLEQIERLYTQQKKDNVKQGWHPVDDEPGNSDPCGAEPENAQEVENQAKPAKKAAKKKPAAKKSTGKVKKKPAPKKKKAK